MRILITGTSGHLGEALARTLLRGNHEVVGLDVAASPFTTVQGSITDRETVRRCMRGTDVVLHTAGLHKPHVVTHSADTFAQTNVAGTAVLLEEAASHGVGAFILTSTTSVFGEAARPPADAPAAWITEDVPPAPRNVYGITKRAAEDLCALFHRKYGVPCLILRTSRFFPDEDDRASVRAEYDDANVKANEYLYRRVDLEDTVTAHLLAIERASDVGFGRYIISATTPFNQTDLAQLREDAPGVVRRYFPTYEEEYARRGWKMFPSVERVYVNARARAELGWRPRYDYARVLEQLRANEAIGSELSRDVGIKGYHGGLYEGGRYPTE